MTADEARERIVRLEKFIAFMEGYQAETFEQKACKLYVEIENVNKVSEILKKEGYKSPEGKSLVGKDITNLIQSRPADEMHSKAKEAYKRNAKRRQ